VKTLDFDAGFTGSLLGSLGPPLAPPGCRTAAHVAGAGEVAVVTFAGTISIIGGGSPLLSFHVMTSVNGGSPTVASATPILNYVVGFGGGSATKRIPLTAGSSYVFGAGFGSDTAANLDLGRCQGTVIITRQ
jgi:hypothetical protein